VGLLDGLKEKVRQRDRARLERKLDPVVTQAIEDKRERQRQERVDAEFRAQVEAEQRAREAEERRREQSERCNKCKGTGKYSFDDGERNCPKCKGSGKK